MKIQRYNVFRMNNTIRDKAINTIGKLLVPVQSDEGEIVFYKDHEAAMRETQKQMLRFAEWYKRAGCSPVYYMTVKEAFNSWQKEIEPKESK